MSGVLSILAVLCLVSLAQSVQTEGSSLDWPLPSDDSQPPFSGKGNESATPKESNLQETGDNDNTQNKTSNGEAEGSKSGRSVPLKPLKFLPPVFDDEDEEANTYSNENSRCGVDACKMETMCTNASLACIMDSQCKSRCVSNGSATQMTPALKRSTESLRLLVVSVPESTESYEIPGLRPLIARTCDASTGYICVHGAIEGCPSSMKCMCDKGWNGLLCDDPCTLPCVHGNCRKSHNNKETCTCQWNYQGELCDEFIHDPQERARTLAAILSSALAVAIILSIIVPVILWKMRVTFVLKLVYYFKEYEDEDGKTFDAYVSMTPTVNAESFVYGSLRPILEDLNFTLYLQARDAPANEVLSETILSALERSRRTIMIVTRDYITNEWNRFEYLIAQHETLKLKQRIIPIILEDIDKESSRMDKSLKHILDSVKCLEFPRAKPKTITLTSVESPDIQSPDSNRSKDSTTQFYKEKRQYGSGVSISKEEQKFERKVAKFWKHLALTMPKKKSKENESSDILAKLRSRCSYDLSMSSLQHEKQDCNSQSILNLNYKNTFVKNSHTIDDNFEIKISDLCNDGTIMKGDQPCNMNPSMKAVDKFPI